MSGIVKFLEDQNFNATPKVVQVTKTSKAKKPFAIVSGYARLSEKFATVEEAHKNLIKNESYYNYQAGSPWALAVNGMNKGFYKIVDISDLS